MPKSAPYSFSVTPWWKGEMLASGFGTRSTKALVIKPYGNYFCIGCREKTHPAFPHCTIAL
jgi:hypothetical protein